MHSIKRLAAVMALALMAMAATAVTAHAVTVTPVDGTLTGEINASSANATLGAGFATVSCTTATTTVAYTEDGTGIISAINFDSCQDSIGRTCVVVTDTTLDAVTAAGKVVTEVDTDKPPLPPENEDNFTLTLTVAGGTPGANGVTGNVTCTGFLGTTTCTFRGDGTVVSSAGTSGTVAGTTIGTAQSTSATISFNTGFTRTAGSTTCSNPSAWGADYTAVSTVPVAANFSVTS